MLSESTASGVIPSLNQSVTDQSIWPLPLSRAHDARQGGEQLHGVGFSWHYFCIQNNSVITGYSLPEDLDYKMGDAASFTKIRYGDTACVPIRNKDIFYDVAWGGFQINDKSIAAKLFKCDGRNCAAKFDIGRSINFSVYSKLTLAASSLVYLLFVAAIYGIIELITSIYKYVVRE